MHNEQRIMDDWLLSVYYWRVSYVVDDVGGGIIFIFICWYRCEISEIEMLEEDINNNNTTTKQMYLPLVAMMAMALSCY